MSDAHRARCQQPLLDRMNRRAHRELLVAGAAAGRRAAAAGSVSIGKLDRFERFHHALADTPRRHVDHAPQADVVVRVQNQLEVREGVLDFLALVEPDAADDLVGRCPTAAQRVFERSRLRVGAIQNRDRVRPGPRASAVRDGAGDELRLVEIVTGAVVAGCFAPPRRSV